MNQYIRCFWIFVLLCGLLTVLPATSSFAEPAEEITVKVTISQKWRGEPIPDQEDGQKMNRNMALIANSVRYFVPANIVVVSGANGGEKLTMDTLPVPCSAELTFLKLDNRNPVVTRINVLKRHSGSSWAWASDGPQDPE